MTKVISGRARLAPVLAATINMITLSAALVSSTCLSLTTSPALAEASKATGKNEKAPKANSGTLIAFAPGGKQVGECPLQHTDVTAKVSGYVARVNVKQVFHNPYKQKIEAVYTFPLSESGAVDEMTMKVGTRTIRGTIKKREEAKQIYEEAKAAGHVAALLDQERTNIFTQSVANIEPGETVEITLQYVELLKYEAGKFSFTFPTVVGPRFNPGTAISHEGTGRANDTDQVPDASRITPPVTPAGTRAGHDIAIQVAIDAGVPISDISSKLHEVNIHNEGSDSAVVDLKDQETMPNRDFVLSWDVAQSQLKSGYLTHKDKNDKSGFFTIMMLPPKRVAPEEVAPKEMIFLVDCSGSQDGPPLQKAKETLTYIIDHMNANDTIQIIAFSDKQLLLSDKPEKFSTEMKAKAKQFINHLSANGGTWMAPAVEKAIAVPADGHRLRIVTFMTDGFVGNDREILSILHKHRDTSRWFPFGTGNSVNRELIDGIAKEGGGEADYVLLNSSAQEVGKKFYDRISSPVLTDVKVDFGKLDVKEVFPKEVNDVWAERPLYFKGRYLTPGKGTVTLTGFAGGKPYKQNLDVDFPALNNKNDVLTSIWARAKVDRLMSEDYSGANDHNINKELKEEIISTALQYHIMTDYTSFVAVEEKTVTKGGVPTQVTVPVEMPQGVSRDKTLNDGMFPSLQGATNGTIGPMAMKASYGFGYGGAKRTTGAIRGSLMRQAAASTPSPAPAMVPRPTPIAHSAGGAAFAMAPRTTEPRPTALPQADAGAAPDADDEKSANKKSNEKAPAFTYKIEKSLQALLGNSSPSKQLQIKGYDAKRATVEVSIELTDATAATFRKLERSGLLIKVEKKNGKITATIKVSNLLKLAKLDYVKAIAPIQ